jgi:16S rRNA (cytosine1402-N4)-methyltransferase
VSQNPDQKRHTPVLLKEVLETLTPQPGEQVLDVTLGLGGHAKAFLEATQPGGGLTAIDADTDNLEEAKRGLTQQGSRVTYYHGNFRGLPSLALPHFDIIFADLGISSPHLDDPEKGFSFRFDGPLDMRLDRTQGQTAAELLMSSSKDALRKIFREYADLKEAHKVAAILDDALHGKSPRPITTTTHLKALIEEAFGWRTPQVLPQVFQAIRIAVNDELGALQDFLDYSPTLLKPGGRLGIISFHSLEDRLVKQKFKDLVTLQKDEVTGQDIGHSPFEILTKKPLDPSEEECRMNPRARSAKFRALRRVK